MMTFDGEIGRLVHKLSNLIRRPARFWGDEILILIEVHNGMTAANYYPKGYKDPQTLLEEAIETATNSK